MSSFPLTAYADAQFRLIRDDRRWMRSNLILTYTIRTQIKGTEPQHYRAVVKETESLLQFEICSRTNKPFWSRDISIIFTFTLSHEPTLYRKAGIMYTVLRIPCAAWRLSCLELSWWLLHWTGREEVEFERALTISSSALFIPWAKKKRCILGEKKLGSLSGYAGKKTFIPLLSSSNND